MGYYNKAYSYTRYPDYEDFSSEMSSYTRSPRQQPPCDTYYPYEASRYNRSTRPQHPHDRCNVRDPYEASRYNRSTGQLLQHARSHVRDPPHANYSMQSYNDDYSYPEYYEYPCETSSYDWSARQPLQRTRCHARDSVQSHAATETSSQRKLRECQKLHEERKERLKKLNEQRERERKEDEELRKKREELWRKEDEEFRKQREELRRKTNEALQNFMDECKRRSSTKEQVTSKEDDHEPVDFIEELPKHDEPEHVKKSIVSIDQSTLEIESSIEVHSPSVEFVDLIPLETEVIVDRSIEDSAHVDIPDVVQIQNNVSDAVGVMKPLVHIDDSDSEIPIVVPDVIQFPFEVFDDDSLMDTMVQIADITLETPSFVILEISREDLSSSSFIWNPEERPLTSGFYGSSDAMLFVIRLTCQIWDAGGIYPSPTTFA